MTDMSKECGRMLGCLGFEEYDAWEEYEVPSRRFLPRPLRKGYEMLENIKWTLYNRKRGTVPLIVQHSMLEAAASGGAAAGAGGGR